MRRRLRLEVRGVVQGVGFRPYIYRLARRLDLAGWVNNGPQGVTIEVEGTAAAVEDFQLWLPRQVPPLAAVHGMETAVLDPVGYETFQIRPSDEVGEPTALVLPDMATCRDCLREICDPDNRRWGYPFTNCTHCGPRYSIIEALPYDRPHTTMRRFTMCPACRAEYEDPGDRRFHAQPNACPQCGPQVELWDGSGAVVAAGSQALEETARALEAGRRLAIKGLGGFHLMVDATNDKGVAGLRQVKHREEKPLALMYPDLELLRRDCQVGPLEESLLTAPEAPIVLLPRCAGAQVAVGVAPGNPYLGAMLPYTPLHHLLLNRLGRPLVATSGNRADEPICIDQHQALERLAGLAELFLVHDRPIHRHVDDSIVRLVGGRPMMLRRARGYAPLPVRLDRPVPPLVAVGGQLKNTVAVGVGKDVFLSQHIGDLETVEARAACQQVAADLQDLYRVQPRAVVCDQHPDYASTHLARTLGQKLLPVQHHYAHVLACMADNQLGKSCLGVSWDGTGYGPDKTVWGGEFLRPQGDSFTRVAHLRPFRLPGGEEAVRQPRRSAVGLLYELYGAAALERTDWAPVASFTAAQRPLLARMLETGLNAPLSTSAGRLFDAVAALAGLRQESRFEGQAAMELEWCIDPQETGTYLFALRGQAPLVVDWGPALQQLESDIDEGVGVGAIAAKFHCGLAAAIVAVAQQVGEDCVVLTGGCFQNKYLTELTVDQLRAAGLRPYWHQRIPPNDGGIALGQAVAAMRAGQL
ncbi:MAG: carbamoyltransferase HypF [Candidatus Latescibacteria bacterium]|nr:carbamoyltransferase HypF [Candidatus Latescibacterota bacterium]